MASNSDLDKKSNKNQKVTNNEEKKSSNNSASKRVKKNEHYYEMPDFGLTFTKQQKFNFDNNNYEDDMDTSFLDKPRKKKNDTKVIVKKPKYLVIINLFLLFMVFSLGGYILYHYINFDHKKVKVVTKTKIEKEEVVPENILFLGDSITDFYDLEKYFPDMNTVNSGISGDITDDILENMKNRVYQYNPSKVFLLIGTNDLNKNATVDKVVENIETIIKDIQANRPKSEIYVESIYPINKTDDDKIDKDMVSKRDNQDIREINSRLSEFCHENKITFIDMYKELQDEDENLKLEYTKEGLHLSDEGYEVVTNKLLEYLK